MPPSSYAEDAWFDLVPLALLEFNEQGRVLRANSALSALLGYAIPPGSALADMPQALQRLCGWDAPLTLLALAPQDAPLQNQVTQPRSASGSTPTAGAVQLLSLVWAHEPGLLQQTSSPHPSSELTPSHPQSPVHVQADAAKRFLCAIRPSSSKDVAAPQPSSITSDADAAPVPDQAQLLHELSTILESTPAGIAYLRGDVLVRCNRRFERMLGLTPGTMAGQHLGMLLASDPRIDRVVTETATELLRTEQFESEIEIAIPDQAPRWYALSARRIGSTSESLEVIVVLSDITRIRNQQAQLEAMGQNLILQADRTRAILDSVFVGIVTLDAYGIAWMNRSARRMFGGDLADFVGQPLSTVATPDLDHPFRLTDYLDHLQDGQSHTFECQVVGRDGRVFWVVGNAVVTLGEANQRHITYALLDIDRRREAEAESAEAQATLQRIIEMAPMAINLIDAHELTLVQANQAATAFMNVDLAKAQGKPPEALYEADRARAMRADMQHALDTGESIHREYTRPYRGVNQIWEVNYLPLARDAESADQLLVVASDITEQRAAEQARLDAAIAQREMLVKEVHHRIKNNLQGVAGLLQQIAARKPEVASAISEVVGQVQAIAQVYGLQVGAGGPLRLKSVVEAIAQSVQRTFTRQIALSVEGPHADDWQLPEAESIPIALCLNELLTNAHKHGSGPESLQCSLSSSEQGVSIQIRSPGQLPPGFNIDRVPGGVSGLGLVRALLPRRSAKLKLTQDDKGVLTSIDLTPPGINLIQPPHLVGDATGHQIALWPQ